jgi:hypothetical protein
MKSEACRQPAWQTAQRATLLTGTVALARVRDCAREDEAIGSPLLHHGGPILARDIDHSA